MKRKILFNYSIILVLGFSLFMPSGCSGKKHVKGIVQDIFGNGVEGVSVKIIKSGFATTTNKAGSYSLDYVPGTFTINFSKPGYTTHKLELSIREKTKFPVEPVIIFPIPEREGIYYIGEKDLIEIKPVEVKKAKRKVKYKSSIKDIYFYRYYASSKGTVTIKPGEAKFIDTISRPIAFFKLGHKYTIQDYTISGPGGIKYIYNGLTKDKSFQKSGEELLNIRTVELKSGNYGWVELVEKLSLGIGRRKEPSEKSLCYPFIVESAADELKKQ